MSITIVLWIENNRPAIEQRIAVDSGPEACVCLREINFTTWTIQAPSFLSIFNVESGAWKKLCLDEDTLRLKVPGGVNTILMRMPGVSSCPDFGEELETIYCSLPLPPYEPQTPPSELVTAVQQKYLVEKRVVLWEKDGTAPAVFGMCMTNAFEVNWSLDTTITSHLDGAFAFEMWELDALHSSIMSATEAVRLPQDQRTILLRRVGVKYTVGLGREIIALQAQVLRFQENLDEPLFEKASQCSLRIVTLTYEAPQDIYQCSPPRRLLGQQIHNVREPRIAGLKPTSEDEHSIDVKAERETISENGKETDTDKSLERAEALLRSDTPQVKCKVAYVGRASDVEKVLRWKKCCGMVLGDVEEAWRAVLPPDLFDGPVLGNRSHPIDVDNI